jgi:hypothetical protein
MAEEGSRQMDLSCPKCQHGMEVPDKAFLFWRNACPRCGVVLSVAAVERPAAAGATYLACELIETQSGGSAKLRQLERQ